MGYKASMIIVKDPSPTISDIDLISSLGYTAVSLPGNATLEECIYSNDKTINIGHYNNCLIITEDYLLTESLDLSKTPQNLSNYEKALSNLYPNTEILTVACHSVVNYHLYSLVANGKKVRFKKIVPDEPIIEWGSRFEEEELIYANSKLVDGIRMFKSEYEEDGLYDNTENQMMEEFTFGIAGRHLGVMISTGEDEELMYETVFKKYKVTKSKEIKKEAEQTTNSKQAKNSWFLSLFRKS